MESNPLRNFNPQVVDEIRTLGAFLADLHIFIIVSGRTIKILDVSRKVNVSLEDAVSLYNRRGYSYAKRYLKTWQLDRLLASGIAEAPLTLQRSCGSLVVSKRCEKTAEEPMTSVQRCREKQRNFAIRYAAT